MISLTNDQFQAKFKTAPYAVRNFVMGVELEEFVASAGSKYQLHVDTLGKFSDVVTALLLGVITPAQLPKELSELGISSANISGLTQDLNEKVFKPLREQMQNEGEQETETSVAVLEKTPLLKEQVSATTSSQIKTPAAQPVARPSIQTSRPAIQHPPRPTSAPVTARQPRPQAPQPAMRPQTPPPVRPAVSVPPQSKPTPPVFAPFPKAVPPPPQPAPIAPAPRTAEEIASSQPAIRTMMRDADQAQHPAVAPQPTVVTEPKSIPTPPRIATAPVTTPSFDKTPASPTPNAQELNDTLKKYGVDPYREPVE
jgi:hypothetical protein